MDVFDTARKTEVEISYALQAMEEEAVRLLADARMIGENMKTARLLASIKAGMVSSDLAQSIVPVAGAGRFMALASEIERMEQTADLASKVDGPAASKTPSIAPYHLPSRPEWPLGRD